MRTDKTSPSDFLKKSPIFAMSHGGLELFHSNVWAWLIEHDSRYATVFFPKLDGQTVFVEREQNHRDLTIWAQSNPSDLFVVENKTKTLPRADQLEQYSEAIRKEGKTLREGIIVGVIDPALSVDGWSWLGLKTIAQRILDVAENEPNGNIKAIVQEYGETTKAMCDLLESCVKNLAGELPDPRRNDKELEDLHLRDIYFKLGANLFVRKFGESDEFNSWRTRFNELGLDLRVADGFSNKTWCIDIKAFKTENREAFDESKGNPFITFGIQIQGIQFRRMAEVFHAARSNQFDDIFNRFQKLDWFDAGVGTAGWRDGCKTSQRKPNNKTKAYAKYSPAFVYQYIDLEDFSYSSISGAIFEHLDEVLRLVKTVPVKTVFSLS